MLQRIIAPGTYRREAGIRHKAGGYCKPFGKNVYIIGGKNSLEITQAELRKSLEKADLNIVKISWYGGLVSWQDINNLVVEAQDLQADLIIGVGGGKALDTAKAVAYKAEMPIITVPTIAATCAAWTPLSAVYDEQGQYLELSPLAQNPSMVLVDTEIIAEAPVDLLIAGIGDTLAKWYELEATVRGKEQSAAVRAAYEMAKLCKQTLIDFGGQAIIASEKQQITPELEQIIDANIFLSGMVSGLGGDECRAGGAHALYNGLTVLPEVHAYYHGSIVAYGILCQLVLDKREDEVVDLIPFYQKTNLPYTLKQIGIDNLSEEMAYKVADASVNTEDMANLPFEVTIDDAIAAIRKVDQLGREVGK